MTAKNVTKRVAKKSAAEKTKKNAAPKTAPAKAVKGQGGADAKKLPTATPVARLEAPAPVKPVAPPAPPKKLGCLDAAAKVLAEATGPLSSKELILQMAERNLWSSPAGQTPHATLYSAIGREIKAKGWTCP